MAVKLARTSDPIIGDSLVVDIVGKYPQDSKLRGARMDFTGAAFWITLKDVLADADALADIQGDTTNEGAWFSVGTPATNGEITITVPAASTAALTAGRLYYTDIQVKLAGGEIYTLVRDELRFIAQVTIASTPHA